MYYVVAVSRSEYMLAFYKHISWNYRNINENMKNEIDNGFIGSHVCRNTNVTRNIATLIAIFLIKLLRHLYVISLFLKNGLIDKRVIIFFIFCHYFIIESKGLWTSEAQRDKNIGKKDDEHFYKLNMILITIFNRVN